VIRQFPVIDTEDLDGRVKVVPEDLPYGPRIVVVSFQRWQISLIREWLTALEPLIASYPTLSVWSVAVISRTYAVGKTLINEGMRDGTPVAEERAHTLVAYVDVRGFTHSLGITDVDVVYAFVVDTNGTVHATVSGEPTAEGLATIEAALK
jgi:hypothetical protein